MKRTRRSITGILAALLSLGFGASALAQSAPSNPAQLCVEVDATAPMAASIAAATTTSPAGQKIVVLIPNSASAKPYRSTSRVPLILYVHGSGESFRSLLDDPRKTACVAAMLEQGYILAGSAAHGTDNWGNQASVDDYVDLYRYCAAHYSVGKVIIWSQSMGGLDGLTAIAENKVPNVVGWLGTYPVCNLANLYSGGGFTSRINAAYGITGTGASTFENLTAGLDPAVRPASDFHNLPMRFYASPEDTIVPKAQNTDLLAAHMSSSTAEHEVVPCHGNHGDASHFQPADYLSFIQRCLAR